MLVLAIQAGKPPNSTAQGMSLTYYLSEDWCRGTQGLSTNSTDISYLKLDDRFLVLSAPDSLSFWLKWQQPEMKLCM